MQHVRIRNLFVSLKTIPGWNGFRWHYLVFRCIIIMYPCAKASERHLLYTHTCLYIHLICCGFLSVFGMDDTKTKVWMPLLPLSVIPVYRLFNSTCLRISFSHSFLQVPVCLSQRPMLANRQLRLPNKTSKNTKKPSPKHIFRHFEFLKNIMYYLFAQSNPSTYIPISMAWAQLHAMQSWKHALK